MARPIKNLNVYGGIGFFCEKCNRLIACGDKWAEVKWKKYRKKRIYLVCESCAEGIVKEFESEVKL